MLGKAEIAYRQTFAAQQLMIITASARFEAEPSVGCARRCIDVLLEIEKDGNLAPSIVKATPDCARDVVSTATLGETQDAQNLIGYEKFLAEGARNLLMEFRSHEELKPVFVEVAAMQCQHKAAKKPARCKAA